MAASDEDDAEYDGERGGEKTEERPMVFVGSEAHCHVIHIALSPSMPSDNIHPIDFLNSVPPPLTVALLKLAPCISFIRNVIQICAWSTPTRYHSWLALAAWWATCLMLDRILRCLSRFFWKKSSYLLFLLTIPSFGYFWSHVDLEMAA